jgi:hypothetical protein
MPEIIWKQGAENDLLQIFADLEDYSEGAGERLVRKLEPDTRKSEDPS